MDQVNDQTIGENKMDEYQEILIESGFSRKNAILHAEDLRNALEKRKKKECVLESRQITEPRREIAEED